MEGWMDGYSIIPSRMREGGGRFRSMEEVYIDELRGCEWVSMLVDRRARVHGEGEQVIHSW